MVGHDMSWWFSNGHTPFFRGNQAAGAATAGQRAGSGARNRTAAAGYAGGGFASNHEAARQMLMLVDAKPSGKKETWFAGKLIIYEQTSQL